MKRLLTTDEHTVSVQKFSKRLQDSTVAHASEGARGQRGESLPVPFTKADLDGYSAYKKSPKKLDSAEDFQRALNALTVADYLGDDVACRDLGGRVLQCCVLATKNAPGEGCIKVVDQLPEPVRARVYGSRRLKDSDLIRLLQYVGCLHPGCDRYSEDATVQLVVERGEAYCALMRGQLTCSSAKLKAGVLTFPGAWWVATRVWPGYTDPAGTDLTSLTTMTELAITVPTPKVCSIQPFAKTICPYAAHGCR